jgi:flagellar secretion chaperone FliS
MNAMLKKSALNSYKSYGYTSEVEYADPHRLIQMLLEGLVSRISIAKGAMQRKEVVLKGETLGRAIDIIAALRSCLDHKAGGDIAQNLENLYEYMERRLLLANVRNDEAILDEVGGLVKEVKAAWDAISATMPQP